MDRTGGVRTRGIRYQPLPSQKRFHQSAARFKGFSGPIGSGKSQALCQEAIRLSYLNPGRTGLIGAPTYPMLRDATQAALFAVLAENGVEHEFHKSENCLTFSDTGSKILFRSVDEYERLRGSNLAWFGVDELTYTVQEAWLRLEGRLRDPKANRLCGFAVWTPKGYDWVYERFFTMRPAGTDVVVAKPFENRHLLDRVPDYYERLKGSYDERFYQQEVLGEYLNLWAGRVYSGFERERNVQPVSLDPRRPLLWALDFNVDPMSSVVAQMSGEDVLVLDEIVLSRATTRQACEEFASRFQRHGAGLVVYADATGGRMQSSGTSDLLTLREFFRDGAFGNWSTRIPKSNPAVRERIQLVNGKLKNAQGETHLFVNPRCKELIRDFEQVSYKPDSSVIDKERDPRRTHLSDALGYLVWQECGPRPQVGERGGRLL